MDNIVIIMILVVLAANIMNAVHKHKYPEIKLNKEELCPPHQWEYTETNKLYCTKCSFMAGLKDESEK